jgi:hypothetical protein
MPLTVLPFVNPAGANGTAGAHLAKTWIEDRISPSLDTALEVLASEPLSQNDDDET